MIKKLLLLISLISTSILQRSRVGYAYSNYPDAIRCGNYFYYLMLKSPTLSKYNGLPIDQVELRAMMLVTESYPIKSEYSLETVILRQFSHYGLMAERLDYLTQIEHQIVLSRIMIDILTSYNAKMESYCIAFRKDHHQCGMQIHRIRLFNSQMQLVTLTQALV